VHDGDGREAAGRPGDAGGDGGIERGRPRQSALLAAIHPAEIHLTAAPASQISKSDKEPAMSKPSIEQTRMGTEGIAFCIARTLIERDPSLKAPMRANLRKMWELLEEREDHAAADMVDTMIKALNDPAFFKP
jgi:hypothetical protein